VTPDLPQSPHPASPAARAPGRRPWQVWVVTVLGSGFSPLAPGTAGSAVTAALVLLGYFALAGKGRPDLWMWATLLLAGVIFFSACAVALGRFAIVYFGRKDPGPFVLDEAAGICLTLLFVPTYAGWREVWPVLGAFLAFRVFDVWKPSPARQLENLPEGWGILMDDLMAAVYANLACQAVFRLLVPALGLAP